MLHGWIEIGLSNPNIFNSQSNPDILMRTYDSAGTNKIIIGNTSSNDSPDRLAAMYILKNNVGFKKIPLSNIDVDVNGYLSTIDGRVASNLYIGYGTNQGFIQLRGDLQIINQNTSDMRVINNNNTVQFMYSNIERFKFTNGTGIYLNDNVYITNDVYSTGYHITSDSNFKENFVATEQVVDLKAVRALEVCNFNFKGSPNITKGLIAQNVEKVIPTAVKEIDGIIPFFCGTAYTDEYNLMCEDDYNWTERVVVGDDLVVGRNSFSREYILTVTRVNVVEKYICVNKCIFPDDDGVLTTVYIHGKMGKVKTIDPNQITALCVSAIQELAQRIDALECKV